LTIVIHVPRNLGHPRLLGWRYSHKCPSRSAVATRNEPSSTDFPSRVPQTNHSTRRAISPLTSTEKSSEHHTIRARAASNPRSKSGFSSDPSKTSLQFVASACVRLLTRLTCQESPHRGEALLGESRRRHPAAHGSILMQRSPSSAISRFTCHSLHRHKRRPVPCSEQ